MKNLKVVLASLLLVAGVIAFSSFKSQNYNKRAFTTKCFYFIPVSGTSVETPANWTDAATLDPVGEGLCDDINFLCAICIPDTELDNNKPNADVLSKVSTYTLAHIQGEQIPNSDITVFEKSTQ